MLRYAIRTRELNGLLRLLRDLLDMRVTFFDVNDAELDLFDIKDMSGYCRRARRQPAFDARCRACDGHHLRRARRLRQPVVYRCHARLFEGTVPLYNRSGVYVGAIVFGQFRACGPQPQLRPTLARAFGALPTTTPARMRKVAELIQHLSRSIIDHGLIKLEDRDYMAAVTRYIDQHLAERLTLKQLAAAVGRSPSFVSHHFQREYGVSPVCFARRRRIDLGARLLARGSTVRETAGRCGFCDEFHFSKAFRKHFGVAPSSVRGAAAKRPPRSPRPDRTWQKAS
jgi:AraC-like DNA-binding protein